MARVHKAKNEQGRSQVKSLVSIIDDDESVREGIAGLMASLGLRVKAFSTAVEFLASPELVDSSCIIADVQMPHMTGIELYGRLRVMGYKIPTILVTAYPDDEAQTRALADGIICYLSKPFDKDDLIGCVRSALQSQPT
jgi:FixJ family two-component response regulator